MGPGGQMPGARGEGGGEKSRGEAGQAAAPGNSATQSNAAGSPGSAACADI